MPIALTSAGHPVTGYCANERCDAPARTPGGTCHDHRRRRYTVRLRLCRGGAATHVYRVLAHTEGEAQDRACAARWGRGYYWALPDSGLGPMWGQPGHDLPRRLGGGTSLEPRHRCDVTLGW